MEDISGPTPPSSPRREPEPPVTFRQIRWWTPTRVACAATAVVWVALLLVSLLAGLTSANDPPNGFYSDGYGAAGVMFILGALVAVPLTVIVWLVALVFIVRGSARRGSTQRGSEHGDA